MSCKNCDVIKRFKRTKHSLCSFVFAKLLNKVMIEFWQLNTFRNKYSLIGQIDYVPAQYLSPNCRWFLEKQSNLIWFPIIGTIYFKINCDKNTTKNPRDSHYSDVIMSVMASQTTVVSIVCLTVCSGTDQRKHQSSGLLAFVRAIHWWAVENVSIWWPHHVLGLFGWDWDHREIVSVLAKQAWRI